MSKSKATTSFIMKSGLEVYMSRIKMGETTRVGAGLVSDSSKLFIGEWLDILLLY